MKIYFYHTPAYLQYKIYFINGLKVSIYRSEANTGQNLLLCTPD